MLGAYKGYATFNSLLGNDSTARYRLSLAVEKAYGKEPGKRNRYDKEIINVDERINILYKSISGGFLTIFPIPGDASHKWISAQEAATSYPPAISTFAVEMLGDYFRSVRTGIEIGNYEKADSLLSCIKENQKKYGAAVFPPRAKTSLEIFYINFDIFSKLARLYVFLGLFMVIIQFVTLLWTGSRIKIPGKTGFRLVSLLFLIHSAGLGIRWYISGHAPWSNGYETLIYISWATCLAGLIFSKRSPMTLALTTVLSAVTLFVAGMSWMSPELTNLVPVLKSYWLVIHVAVITASYGFFAVAALLGLINMVLMILQSVVTNNRISFTIKELVVIIEIAFIAGLFMLTTGSFLGGVWANESWGRYWGWDPKETWAMVTILVYAFFTHMHRIQGFRGPFAVSLAAVTGFCSVLMTFFGVNYYLSGLHSYAQGEPVPIPTGVYVAAAVILVLGIASWRAYRHHALSSESEEEDIG